jgi:hypothetical protein
MNQESSFIIVRWFAFMVIISIPVTSLLVWAIKTKQFKNQDKARYLALKASIKEKTPERVIPAKAGIQSRKSESGL